MKINFNKIILHNFLSFNHAEIDLTNKGYCNVQGINHCQLDNAKSNGSGKSSIWSGICWALTGQTIQGVTANIKNLYIDENLCYVTLDFNINNNHYEITRFKEPKSDLKIILDGVDISGKGIRESEQIFSQYLSDLTSDLLSSIILLGQGLPNKLSSKTPSGRKELLEKLSKSDFMIEDIKNRLAERESYLKNQSYWSDTNKTKYETTFILNNQNIDSIKNELSLLQNTNYQIELEQFKNDLTNIEHQISSNSIDSLNIEAESLTHNIQEVESQKLKAYTDKTNNYQSVISDLKNKQTEKQLVLQSLQQEITRLKNISDICPICGQKIPGVIKIDTTDKEEQLQVLKDEYNTYTNLIHEAESTYTIEINNINTKFDLKMKDFKLKLLSIKQEVDSKNNLLSELNKTKTDLLIKSTQIEERLKLRDNNIKELNFKLSELDTKQLELQELIKKEESNLIYYKQHLDIINKMNTLIKRDFRGYLLTNVITYINKVLKEYSVLVFGNNTLDFVLNGNNIDILYNDKIYETLSGGEKQKIDILVQLALRKMLMSYLDFSSNILVLDEIFDNLDSVGVNNIINLIETKLTDIESIFIISHHIEELNLSSDTELTVIKNNLGISEVYE